MFTFLTDHSPHCHLALLTVRVHPLQDGRMTQFSLNDDQRAIRETARRFTQDDITPHAARWDEHHIFPRETVQAAAALGFVEEAELVESVLHRCG